LIAVQVREVVDALPFAVMFCFELTAPPAAVALLSVK